MASKYIWNYYARAYDVINKNVPYLKMLDGVLQEVNINGNLTILDAGCGTGNLIKKLSQVAFNSRFMGIDSSEEMLRRARNKLKSDRNVTFCHADLNGRLDLPDNGFDRIVSVNTLYALDKPECMISEFYRLLKPRGKFVFTNPHDKASFSAIMKGQLRELGPLNFSIEFLLNLPALLIIIFVNVFFLKRNNNYWSKDKVINILREVGFEDINVKLTYADQALLVSAIK